MDSEESNVIWKNVGEKLCYAIVKMNIPIKDLPFVDGRLDVFTFLKTWQRGLKSNG